MVQRWVYLRTDGPGVSASRVRGGVQRHLRIEMAVACRDSTGIRSEFRRQGYRAADGITRRDGTPEFSFGRGEIIQRSTQGEARHGLAAKRRPGHGAELASAVRSSGNQGVRRSPSWLARQSWVRGPIVSTRSVPRLTFSLAPAIKAFKLSIWARAPELRKRCAAYWYRGSDKRP